jgi:methanogenic corrinoid protein MtbC1
VRERIHRQFGKRNGSGMNATAPLAAEILEASAAGFAAAANAELQRRRPDGSASDGRAWQEHLRQRVLELAAAIRVGEPRLFTNRIAWLRRAAAARRAGDADILLALESLGAALAAELPESLAAGVGAVVEQAQSEARQPVKPEDRVIDATTRNGRFALDYIAACLDAENGDPIGLVMRAIDAGLRPEAAYCEVLLPAQREVGQLWHTGDFSVTEERLVSETTRRVMSLIAARFRPATPTGPTLLAASVAGNAHDIGLRVVADLFTLAGWRCIYLGANVPTEEIGTAASEYAVNLAVLTATLTPQLGTLGAAIDEIRRHSPETKVLVGGIAFEASGDLWRKLGADGFAERIDDVVAVGARLTG